MRTILVFGILTIYVILNLPYLAVEWLLSKKNREASELRQLRYVQWIFRVVIRLAGVKLTVTGEENVPTDEAVLYIGNHRSILDVVITYSRCPRRTGYIAKSTIGHVPGLHLFMKRLNCLFLDRKDVKQGMQVILSAIAKINEGISICVFPEGTRNRNKELLPLLPFKEGSMKIATKTGCKIVPMVLTGTAERFEQHLPWIRKGEVTLTYGTPIDPTALDKDTQKHLGVYCQNILTEMLQNVQV